MSAANHSGKEIVSYSVDTDLYDIASSKNADFVEEIKQEILSIVSSILHDRVIVASEGTNYMMLIPLDDKVVLITKGRLVASSKQYDLLRAEL